jgi:hypothetical protein
MCVHPQSQEPITKRLLFMALRHLRFRQLSLPRPLQNMWKTENECA